MQPGFRDLHWANEILIKKYFQPRSIPEALRILRELNGSAKVIAGGTDVIPQLRRGDSTVETLVDITRLPGLDHITMDGEWVRVGGLVTHEQLCSSPLIRQRAGLLAEGAGAVGSPQIRNVATVAGNLVSAEPAADTAIPLLALNGIVKIVSSQNTREVPLTEFFLGKGETVIDSRREIMTEIRFPALKKNQGGCYLRLSKRKALSLPILAVGCVVAVDPTNSVIEEARIAMGPVAPVPFRASRTEAALCGRLVSVEILEMATQIAFEESSPRSSLLRGSHEYRKEMVKVLVRRGLSHALREAGAPLPITGEKI